MGAFLRQLRGHLSVAASFRRRIVSHVIAHHGQTYPAFSLLNGSQFIVPRPKLDAIELSHVSIVYGLVDRAESWLDLSLITHIIALVHHNVGKVGSKTRTSLDSRPNNRRFAVQDAFLFLVHQGRMVVEVARTLHDWLVVTPVWSSVRRLLVG